MPFTEAESPGLAPPANNPTFNTAHSTIPHSSQPSSSAAPLLYSPTRDLSLPTAYTATNNNDTRNRAYPLHPGCVLCGLVASASSTSAGSSLPPSPYAESRLLPSSPLSLPRSYSPTPSDSIARGSAQGLSNEPYPQPFASSSSSSAGSNNRPPPITDILVSGRRIVYRDEDITVYPAEGKEQLCPDGRHLIVVLNRHAESVYELGASDVPVLSHILSTAERLLLSSAPSTTEAERNLTANDVRVGFVGGITRDPRSPHAHLHAHAFLGPFNKSLPGSTLWRRNVVFGGLNWWNIIDLRAEIREETSNNRVKSGYTSRRAPIDKVPDAGSVEGLPNALEPDAYADNPTDTSSPLDRLPLNRKDSAHSDSTVKDLRIDLPGEQYVDVSLDRAEGSNSVAERYTAQ